MLAVDFPSPRFDRRTSRPNGARVLSCAASLAGVGRAPLAFTYALLEGWLSGG